MAFAINFLSRFAFNDLLIPALARRDGSSIVHVAAAGMPGALDIEQIPPSPKASSINAHSTGQYADDVYGLAMRAPLAELGISIAVLNPGMVDTEIRRSEATGPLGAVLRLVDRMMRPFAVPPERIANVVVRLVRTPLSPAAAAAPHVLFDSKGRPLEPKAAHAKQTLQDELLRRSAALVARITSGAAHVTTS